MQHHVANKEVCLLIRPTDIGDEPLSNLGEGIFLAPLSGHLTVQFVSLPIYDRAPVPFAGRVRAEEAVLVLEAERLHPELVLVEEVGGDRILVLLVRSLVLILVSLYCVEVRDLTYPNHPERSSIQSLELLKVAQGRRDCRAQKPFTL